MARFQYACFISYKHPPRTPHLWLEFVEALQKQLDRLLSSKLPVYWDNQLKATPGIKYPQELAEKLCKSVCMVAVLVQEYQESNWCCAEWEAMQNLEDKRLGKNHKEGLIIPVLLKGDKSQAEVFAQGRQLVELRVINPRTQLNTIKNGQVIANIAERIDKLVKRLDDTGMDCGGFNIPVQEEVNNPTLEDPDPTKWSG